MAGVVSIDLRRKVTRAVGDVPLGLRDVRGVPGEPNTFISLKDEHNGIVPECSVKVGPRMVNVFKVPGS